MRSLPPLPIEVVNAIRASLQNIIIIIILISAYLIINTVISINSIQSAHNGCTYLIQ